MTSARLLAMDGSLAGKELSISQNSVTIGRQADCDVRLRGDAVSRRHARIYRDGGTYFLEDLGSLNGTKLNDRPIVNAVPLTDGDRIDLHEQTFVFRTNTAVRSHKKRIAAAGDDRFTQRAADERQTTLITSIDANASDWEQVHANAAAKLRGLLSMIRSLESAHTLQQLLANIVNGLLQVFPAADQACILLLVGGDNRLELRAFDHRQSNPDNPLTVRPISQELARRVMSQGQAVIGSDQLAGVGREETHVLDARESRFTMCAPLIGLARKPIGAIQLDAVSRHPRFAEADLEVLASTSSFVGQAIERMRGEERFRRLLESAPDAMVFVDQLGEIVMVNEQAERMFGWGRTELVGKPVETLVPRRYRELHVQHRQRYFDNPTTRPMGTGLQLFGLRKDGSLVPVEISLSPLETEAGMLTSVAIRDISQRRRMESALAEQHQRLLQTERLAAIGEMIAGISHESRNALQRLQACLHMLHHRVHGDNDLLELVAEMQTAQDQLSHLYDQVRQFASPIQVDLARHRLDQLVAETWNSLTVQREGRQATLRQELGGLNLRCEVDAFAIGQVLRNVLENALSACSDPVEITVCYELTLLHERPACCISIRDNGPGLSDEQRQKLFAPFYTTKTRGSGLGMAIAKRLVEAHHGTIVAGNAEPQGAEIMIALPRRQRKPQ